MTNREMKLSIIEEIINLREDNVSPFVDRYLNALYEIIINEDYDYIEDLFYNKQDFKNWKIKFYICEKCFKEGREND